ncbi:MAG: acyltransferase family protein [Promethearchaeota archaeon]
MAGIRKNGVIEEKHETPIDENQTIKKQTRYLSFDIIRGLGIMIMVFLHAAVFHYGKINEIDMDNLDPFLMLLYVLIMWGGLFGAVSGAVNTVSTIRRVKKNPNDNRKVFKATLISLGIPGILFILMHFVYYMVLGPTNYDMESGTHNHNYSFIPGSIRTGTWYNIQTDRWFEQSSLMMIGMILIFLGIILYFLFKDNGIEKVKRNQRILYVLGSLIIFLSFLRIYLFPVVVELISDEKYLLAWIIALFGYEPFPILPYLGFGILAGAYAITLEQQPRKNLKTYYWLGIAWLILFIVCFLLPDSFYESLGLLDDIFIMYLLVIFQIALFQIAMNFFVFGLDKSNVENDPQLQAKQQKKWNQTKAIRQFGASSLTIFLFERILSNLFAKVLDSIIPEWNSTIVACIIFGIGMVSIWAFILWIWKKGDYKYSIEWIWTRLLTKIGKKTTKIEKI